MPLRKGYGLVSYGLRVGPRLDSGLRTQDSRLKTHDSRLQALLRVSVVKKHPPHSFGLPSAYHFSKRSTISSILRLSAQVARKTSRPSASMTYAPFGARP